MALPKEYGDLALASIYFEHRLDADAWVSASDTDKEKALRTAAGIMNGMEWAGQTADPNQEHAFPRTGFYFDRMHQRSVSFSSAHTERRVREALFELAYHLLNNDGLLDSSGGVRSLKVGSIELIDISEASKTPSPLYSRVADMLVSGGTGGSGALWWRAN